MNTHIREEADWPQRSWALAIAGALVGYSIYLMTYSAGQSVGEVRLALSAFLLVAGIATAFTVERGKLASSLGFAFSTATVVGLVVWVNSGSETYSWENWRIACAFISVAIAAPLFLAWRDAGSPWPARPHMLDYRTIHDRAWTGVVLAAACVIFAGVAILLAQLLGGLFKLIGIHAVQELVWKQGFNMTLFGGAFGAASGVLRDRERILGTLQSVVRKVLSVLGPVLGVGLACFILALPFTGLAPLWDATRSTTPILLAAIIAALILINAAIGDSPADEAKSGILNWGSMLLALSMLPLAVIAATSTKLRIGQHGITPDRLWASVFVGIACAYGAAYLYALIRKRGGWWAEVRRLNVWMALGLCLLALLLASPLANFGGWSTRNQLARLESGAVKPERFDWTALRFDFGESGRKALDRLAAGGKTPEIRKAAADATKLQNRWEAGEINDDEERIATIEDHLTILPTRVDLPESLKRRLIRYSRCEADRPCLLIYGSGEEEAVLAQAVCDRCAVQVHTISAVDGKAEGERGGAPYASESSNGAAKAIREGKAEIRTVTRRQLFLDGQPAGDPFE